MTSMSTSLASLERRYEGVRSQYRSGVIDLATSMLRDAAVSNPDDPQLLRLRGLLALKSGQQDFAQACLERAVAMLPSDAGCLTDLGDLLDRRDRPGESLAAYRQAAVHAPQDAALQCRIGNSLLRQALSQQQSPPSLPETSPHPTSRDPISPDQKRLDEAWQAFQAALHIDPLRSQTHCDIGNLHVAQGSLTDAIVCCEHAIRLDPNNFEAYRLLGAVYVRLKDRRAAVEILRAGLARNPERADLHTALGEALLWSGRFQEAAEAFRAALTLEPHDVETCRHLASVLQFLGRRDDAIGALYRLGQALERRGQLAEAGSVYKRVLKQKPNSLKALVQLASVKMSLGQPAEAIPYFEAALAIEPDHAAAHQRLGFAHALTGNLEKNWDETAWIDRYGPWKRFEQPLWDGSSLDGKTILLWINAGLGDMIQFLRFVPFVKERGARVVIESRRQLVPLVQSMACVDQVVPLSTPMPRFDVHAFLATIPRVLRTGWHNIPNRVPYIHVDPGLKARWRAHLGDWHGRSVGLVWASARDPYRYIPLSAFARFADLPKVRFISLQFGPQAVELFAPPAGLRIESPLDESFTVVDTAAVIQNLDLVISMDTLVAHLAGALGQRTWTFLPFARDWRWGLDGEETPWYPTMRLFRQRRLGEWVDVLDRMRVALDAFMSET